MKQKNKIFLIIFLVLLISVPTHAGSLKGEPQGTSPDNPYLIYTEEDLRKVGNDPDWTMDKHYKLMNDIVLPQPEEGESNWTPIGSSEAPFTGTFDGNNKVIYGMTIRNSDISPIGFFSEISGKQTKIENLGLVNVDIFLSERKAVGGLVAINREGTISNCYVTGNISSQLEAGGLVSANLGVISKSYTSGNIEGNSAGGLAVTNCGIIEFSYSNMNVTGHMSVGGLVGTQLLFPTESATEPIIQQCYSTGTVYSFYDSGGIAGHLLEGTIRDCYSTSDITSQYGFLGGIASSLTGLIDRCYFSGDLKAGFNNMSYTGSIAGTASDAIIQNCFVTVFSFYIVGYNTNTNLFNNYRVSYSENLAKGQIIKESINNQNLYQEAGWDFSSDSPIWIFDEKAERPKLVEVFEKTTIHQS